MASRRRHPDFADADEEVTALILARDLTTPGWQRRAVGIPAEEALAQIPSDDAFATIQAQLPRGAYRVLQRHIFQHGINQAAWLREAIVERYLLEGGDKAVAAQLLAMKREQKRHHVPRDPYGQPRGRQGRKGNLGTPKPW